MSKTRYYFFISSYRKGSPNYMKRTSVHRMRDGTKPEWWNPKSGEWELNTDLLAASGIGGDNDYYKTTEAEAMDFLQAHKGRRRTAPRV